MKKLNCNVMSLTNANSGAQAGGKIDSNQLYNASFHCIFSSATAGGTIKIQVSNDIFTDQYQPDTFTPSNWVDLPNQSAVIATGTSAILTMGTVSYRWMRLVWTGTGGGGTVNVNMFAVAV